MSNEFMTPVGRMVQGHPMELRPVLDKQGVQKINKLGDPQVQAFVALAIPKGGETDWKQTEWGQQILAAGQAGWPGGEHGAPTFAWKITDGDSRVPNKKGKLPCNNEGFPGHWVINAQNGFAPDCFANGIYTTQVMRKETFKAGDYIRLVLDVKANGSVDSPGVYVNMRGCELVRAGAPIVSASSIDGQAMFGSVAAVLPQGAQVDPNIQQPAAVDQQTAPAPAPQAPAPQTVQPADDFLTVNGEQWSVQQLRNAKWSEEQITAAR